MKIKLSTKAQKELTYQSYGPQPEIDGVFCHPLRKHRQLEGYFMEHLRLTGGAVEGLPVKFELRQLSLAAAEPGRVNAFHLHPKRVQDELWCCVRGRMRVWLADVRAGSPTEGNRRCFLLSEEEPVLLHIPSGVAHGYQAGPDGALLLYAMNSQFQPDDPNEGRLPWDWFGADLWEEDRG
ncbi:MAG TPA: dTDP-4-dehydrorhamnose 3,5-epimerase family protein [Phycisphaerae bacterium]|nr:dTDP-4-dehydrorhamnose 3,5-epimerase family protein [Phycisphaerae bacterium]